MASVISDTDQVHLAASSANKDSNSHECEGTNTCTQRRVDSFGSRCCRYVLSELHYSSLCCCYTDNKAFLFSPWLPYKWRYQWAYVVYRWVIMFYFLGWLIYIGVGAGQSSYIQAKYLIYLTNWGFLCFNAYLLMAAISVTVSMLYYRVAPPSNTVLPLTIRKEERRIRCTPLSCVTGLHWATSIVGLEFAVAITVLFWIFFNDPALRSATLSVESIHVHMLNGIIAFLDTWISGIPFRILHLVYAVLFGSLYVVFTGIYFAAHGTDVGNRPYIYPVLDYGGNPGLAAGVAVGCGLVFTTLLHLFFYLMYVGRYWLTRLLQTRVYGHSLSEQSPIRETDNSNKTIDVAQKITKV